MRPVRVVAPGPIAAVVFQLDGKEVGSRSESPWQEDVDFGAEYAPHELLALALDVQGHEVARARQWINLPRPPAEVEIVLDRDTSGWATAAWLMWASRMGPQPDRVSLTFDGRELALDVFRHGKLPAYDASLAHVLTAQVEFPNDVRGRADLVLGGGSSGEAGSELTAVPVRCSGKAPPLDALQRRFLKGGALLKVTGIEHAPADVLVVRDLDANREALQLLPALSRSSLFGDPTGLDGEDRLRVQWPVAHEVPDTTAVNVLFDVSNVFHGPRATFAFLIQQVGYPGPNASPRRFADAVAVAGVQAAAGYSRRAVVLVLGGSDWDYSLRDAGSVRRYLERLRVPLYVWSLVGERPPSVAPAAAWGQFDDVSTVANFKRAVDRVRQDLESQSVVWVEGRHLPQDIALVDEGDGMALAR